MAVEKKIEKARGRQLNVREEKRKERDTQHAALEQSADATIEHREGAESEASPVGNGTVRRELVGA